MNSLLRLVRSLRAAPGADLRRDPRQPRRATPTLEGLEERAVPSSTAIITSNFNGTPIAAGTNIWFNSVVKVSGLGSAPATLKMVNSSISFMANGLSYNLPVPDAVITFDPSATTATTTFSVAANEWVSTVPEGLGGNTFLDGVALPVPNGLPAGIKPVTWQGTFQSDTAGLSVNWQWAAAVYPASVASTFNSGYNALGVKPVDDNHASQYLNSDHAGTPENVVAQKPNMPGGATGGGGSNWTGSYSATASVHPTLNASVDTFSLAGTVFNGTSGGFVQGATITLTGTNSQGSITPMSMNTDMNGNYGFSDLQAGTYTLTETAAPPGFTIGTSPYFNILLNQGANQTGYNFTDFLVNGS
jgi:hypothetical protein